MCSGLVFLFSYIFFNVFVNLTVMRRRGLDRRILVRTLGRGRVAPMLGGEEEHVGPSAPVPLPLVGFSGGPTNISLLVKYKHHIARHVWFSEESKRNLFYIEYIFLIFKCIL